MFKSFKNPDTQKLLFQKYSYKSHSAKHQHVIQNHYFNKQIDMIIPDNVELEAKHFKQLNSPVFTVKRVPIHHFLQPRFIEAFVKRGKLHVLSQNTSIDQDDCLCITPTGTLVLNITKDTYEQLGLEARKSAFDKKRRKRYVVELNLQNEKFSSGNKFYDRCLSRVNALTELLTFDIVVTWISHDDKVSNVSIANYFREFCTLSTSVVASVEPRVNIETCWHPHLNNETYKTEDRFDKTEIYEWIGMTTLGIYDKGDCGENDAFTGAYVFRDEEGGGEGGTGGAGAGGRKEGPVNCTVVPGRELITTDAILDFVEDVRDYLTEQQVPWFAVTVHGHGNSPISWLTRERSCCLSQYEHTSYTMIFFTDQDHKDPYDIWCYKSVSSLDTIP